MKRPFFSVTFEFLHRLLVESDPIYFSSRQLETEDQPRTPLILEYTKLMKGHRL